MKKMKRFAALALALGLTLTLGACKKSGLSTFDAKAYVEGLLKETYLGEFDEGYMTLVGIRPRLLTRTVWTWSPTIFTISTTLSIPPKSSMRR